jgi:hypothetical protein
MTDLPKMAERILFAPFGKSSPREKRIETAAETSARIAAAHAEAVRIACPHGAQFYKCECGEEWSEPGYPTDRRCHCCDEVVHAQDNPYRKAWYAGFERAKEMARNGELFPQAAE